MSNQNITNSNHEQPNQKQPIRFKSLNELTPENFPFPNIAPRTYGTLKNKVKLYEKNNNHYLYILPCSGGNGWYEMGENSALIFKYYINKNASKDDTTRIRSDADSHYSPFEIGRIRFSNLGTITRIIKKSGLFAAGIVRDHCIIITLKETIPKETLLDFVQRERAEHAIINAVSKSKLSDPEFYKAAAFLADRLHGLCRGSMDSLSRETYGKIFTENSFAILQDYLSFSRLTPKEVTKFKEAALWRQILKYLDTIDISLSIMPSLDVWSYKKCMTVYDAFMPVKNIAEQHLRETLEKK